MTASGAGRSRAAVRRLVSELTASPLFDWLPPGLLLVFDAELRYRTVDHPGPYSLGPFRREMDGRTLFQEHPADLVTRLEPLYRRALAGDTLTTDLADDQFLVRLRLRPLQDERGAVVAGLCLVEDLVGGHRPEAGSRRGAAGRTDDGDTDSRAAGPRQFESTVDRQRRREAELVGRTGFWQMDAVTRHITWSAGVFALWGFDPETFDGEYDTAASVIHPDDLAATTAAVFACINTGTSVAVRFRITRVSDGAVRWISALGEAVWADGRIEWAGGAVADITDQVQAEVDALAAASFQRAVFSASPDIITVYDFATRSAVWANRSIVPELGYDDADVAGWAEPGSDQLSSRAMPQIVVEDDQPQLKQALVDAHDAVDDRVIHVQYRMRHKNGTVSWFAQSTAPLTRDQHGKVTRIVAVSRDITQAKASEDALHESEERFRQLADNVDVGFVLRSWNDPPEYLYVNPGFERIFGWNPMTMPEHPTDPFAWIHPDDLNHFLEQYWAPAQHGLPTRAEYRIVRPDGQERWIRSSLSPVRDDTGRLRRTASTSEDITSSRQAAAATIAAQTADRANAAKNQFLSRMSHELRTPLNAVLGFAQLLELDVLSTDQHAAVRHIIRGGRHLVGLIDDVLDIAKIEGDQLDMSLESVPVSRLLTETVELMAPQAGAAGITLHCSTTGAAGRSVRADHRRLRQVLLNLLSNAIKYNKPGGRVEISCAINDSSRLDIVVADTGRGMRTEDLPRLFVPFDRLDAATSGIDGTGVGLALSQRLMVHMGGELTASSSLGEGSEFTASVPLQAEQAPESGDVDDVADGDGRASADHPGFPHDDRHPRRTVLYIEDNSSNIALMERVIARRAGWDLLVAGHGALGIELVLSVMPDLVLLDLHLPDMDGLEVLRRIGLGVDSSKTKVIVVSADANPHQVARLLQSGAQHYLTKPLDVDSLLTILDTVEPEQLLT